MVPHSFTKLPGVIQSSRHTSQVKLSLWRHLKKDQALTGRFWLPACPDLLGVTSHGSRATIPFVFKFFRTLLRFLHFLALSQNSTRFFSTDSALFRKNTADEGRGAVKILGRNSNSSGPFPFVHPEGARSTLLYFVTSLPP
jgi:hypothetical protein